jgi:hypothetical protein
MLACYKNSKDKLIFRFHDGHIALEISAQTTAGRELPILTQRNVRSPEAPYTQRCP